MGNRTSVWGRIVANPKLKYLNEKQKVCEFAVASTRKFKKEHTEYFNCVAWNKQADLVNTYLKKGSRLLINGRMQQDKYTDKKGNPQEQIRVVVEEIVFLDSKKEIEIDEPKSDPKIYLRKKDAELNDKEMNSSYEVTDDDLPW